MASEARLEDPLKMVEHLLDVLRRYEDRDGAIERLIQELEDERAALLSGRRLPAAFNP